MVPPESNRMLKFSGFAVLEDEPRKQIWNQLSYGSIWQTLFYTLASSENILEPSGKASCYGTKFQAGRTSSGEPYDMYCV